LLEENPEISQFLDLNSRFQKGFTQLLTENKYLNFFPLLDDDNHICTSQGCSIIPCSDSEIDVCKNIFKDTKSDSSDDIIGMFDFSNCEYGDLSDPFNQAAYTGYNGSKDWQYFYELSEDL
ncbi:MAG: hypothetical protein MHPSP_004830, partial [Paramarteilia canceri]